MNPVHFSATSVPGSFFSAENDTNEVKKMETEKKVDYEELYKATANAIVTIIEELKRMEKEADKREEDSENELDHNYYYGQSDAYTKSRYLVQQTISDVLFGIKEANEVS